MLLVQKYNSLDEIDSEFQDSLESLMGGELASLSLLSSFEKQSPPTLIFYYYLFFGHQHNRPIGFFIAQFIPLPEKEFMSFKERIIKKIKKTNPPKLLRLVGPGNTNAFWFFEAKHTKQGLKEIEKVLKDITTPNILITEEISTSIHSSFTPGEVYQEKSKQLIAPLNLKNNSYETYFNSLENDEKNQVKNIWKNLTQNKSLDITEITESFKLPRAEGISTYLKLDSHFYGLNENGEIKGLIIFTKGKNRELYVDFVVLTHCDNFPPLSYLQNGLMKAFEFAGFENLIFSKNPSLADTYLGLSSEALKLFKFPLMKQSYQIKIHSDNLKQSIGNHDLSRYTTSY